MIYNIKSLEDIQSPDKITIIDCWAPWCGACKSMEKTLTELSDIRYPDSVDVARLNADEANDTAVILNVSGLPTYILYKNGNELDRRSGAIAIYEFGKWLESFI
jgi:thioredoxin-like negative regulator of GroEL